MIRISHHSGILLAALITVFASRQCANGDFQAGGMSDDVRRGAEEFVNRARRVRVDKYGNVHFVMTESVKATFKGKEPRELVKEYKVWSREDKYFRIDTTILTSHNLQQQVGSRRRFIVRPEGYLILFSPSVDKSMAVMGWGTMEDGMGLLFGNDFIQGAARLPSLGQPADIIVEELFSSESYLPDLYKRPIAKDAVEAQDSLTLNVKWQSQTKVTLQNAARLPGDGLELRWTSEDLEEPFGIHTISMQCDPKNGSIRSFNDEFKVAGKPTMSQQTSHEYGPEGLGCIPRRDVRHVVNYPGEPRESVSVRECLTREISWEPVPLGMFSFEAQGFLRDGSERVWVRRLVIAAIGISMLVVALLIKRRRNRAYA